MTLQISRTTDVYKALAPITGLVLRGVVVAIDPSIGSSSSMPGWAVFRTGEYVDSGILEIDPSLGLPWKAQELHKLVYRLYRQYKPDVLVYERIPDQRYMNPGMNNFSTGNSVKAHATLLKAVGAILAVPGPDAFLDIPPVTWKRVAGDTHVKGDEADARALGETAITLARSIEEEEGTTNSGSGVRRGRRRSRGAPRRK